MTWVRTGVVQVWRSKIKRSILNHLRNNNHPSTQTVALKYRLPGLLVLGLGQEMHRVILEHLKIPEGKA